MEPVKGAMARVMSGLSSDAMRQGYRNEYRVLLGSVEKVLRMSEDVQLLISVKAPKKTRHAVTGT
jgi:hypothetical protein